MAKAQKRTQHKQKMGRINLSINDGLLELVDKEAERAFTSRSDIIRIALLWYLKPQGRELDQSDPEIIFKTLQRKHSIAASNKMMRDLGM